MILVNIYGGPASGKTVLSYYLAYRLKKSGHRTELVGEAAREEHIYDSPPGSVAPPLLDNQVLLAGQQYERILRLQRHGFDVAISDSPISQGTMYCKDQFYYNRLFELVGLLDRNFQTYNIFMNRTPGHYDPESRVQRTEADAVAFDNECRDLMWGGAIEAYWDTEQEVASEILTRLAKAKF